MSQQIKKYSHTVLWTSNIWKGYKNGRRFPWDLCIVIAMLVLMFNGQEAVTSLLYKQQGQKWRNEFKRPLWQSMSHLKTHQFSKEENYLSLYWDFMGSIEVLCHFSCCQLGISFNYNKESLIVDWNWSSRIGKIFIYQYFYYFDEAI